MEKAFRKIKIYKSKGENICFLFVIFYISQMENN